MNFSSSDNYDQINSKLIRWKSDNAFRALVEELGGSVLGDYATTTNAFYDPSLNAISALPKKNKYLNHSPPSSFYASTILQENIPKGTELWSDWIYLGP